MSAAAERPTIFALSSGRPPAAIAVIRISGPHAGAALDALAGKRPAPRMATLSPLTDPGTGELLDRALLLWFPGPRSATGEDLAELHVHGGRAVVDGVLEALAKLAHLQPAASGGFTRRAFENGRVDLAEAEGLADLLEAETAVQRRTALLGAKGALSRKVDDWRTRLLALSADVEAAIDYSDEGDVAVDMARVLASMDELTAEFDAVLNSPRIEQLREGTRVVIAGPPNSGKSTLLNALAGRDAAITSPVAGTTRDLIEVAVAFDGLPITLVDTAGLRDTEDTIEAIGVTLALEAVTSGDVLLWLGDDAPPATAASTIALHARLDTRPPRRDRLGVSASTGQNLQQLIDLLQQQCARLLPGEGQLALNRRQYDLIHELRTLLMDVQGQRDPLLLAEILRGALGLCDRLTGKAGVDDMLGSLFARFCVGK